MNDGWTNTCHRHNRINFNSGDYIRCGHFEHTEPQNLRPTMSHLNPTYPSDYKWKVVGTTCSFIIQVQFRMNSLRGKFKIIIGPVVGDTHE